MGGICQVLLEDCIPLIRAWESMLLKFVKTERPSIKPSCFCIFSLFCFVSGIGIDILKLVAAQVGSQWKDIYQFLCNASEREVAAFSNGYTADHERAYAALQHWTIRGPEASLAQLISALRQHRRNDVVEKIRGLMEDTAQVTQPSCLSFLPTFRSLSSRFYQVYVRREKNCS